MAATSVTVRSDANCLQDHFSKVYSATGTIDFASVATGAEAVDTIAVTGVALGDIVLGVSLGVSAADAAITAYVSAANTVTVSVVNTTGGAVDLASTTVRVVVARLAS